MTQIEELEFEIQALDLDIEIAKKAVAAYERRRHQVWMKLNRARRLEREELQNAKD